MNGVSDLRQCLRQPIAELYDAARLLDAAVVAHMSDQRALAADLLISANMPVVRNWLNSIWGSKSEYVSYRATPESKPPIPKAERIPLRRPTVETRLRLHRRDGFHCHVAASRSFGPRSDNSSTANTLSYTSGEREMTTSMPRFKRSGFNTITSFHTPSAAPTTSRISLSRARPAITGACSSHSRKSVFTTR